MITKNYIKQCEQAEEIQKAWKPKTRDLIQRRQTVLKNKQIYLITNIDREIVFYINIKDGEESWCHKDNFKDEFLYIPTQEQLQEMIDLSGWHNILVALIYWYQDANIKEKDINSLNELWLAFVMHEKYNKIWTGKKWVKDE
jgi:hypothetical protein